MTNEVSRICRDLYRAGKSVESISRTVCLPTYDVSRVLA